ncbi:olfactory receptor 10A7-like [Alligator mississippiensis]|uniref:olfactory receptor 10A7-like n=1 Tax=Alligator mississippiensis TaxID=8496 RepID=UPI000711E109|nr:olfactory receptor 10A7-like [Alligator mississippiensis]
MPEGNLSALSEFILLGFSNFPHLQHLLFSLFLSTYLFTLAGNLLIIFLTGMDAALQTPMYFFLGNLSFLEICYTTVNIPKMLASLLMEDRSISFLGCGTQTYFFFSFGGSECFLLASMAYDRYIAICSPLHYPVILNKKTCNALATGSWLSGIFMSFGLTSMVFTLPFCRSNVINHYFCDILPLLKLACVDTSFIELCVFMLALIFIAFPFVLIFLSYIRIVSSILKIASIEGRKKAFSTCSSHLIVVIFFYVSACIIYLKPKADSSPDTNKFLSLLYTFLTPILNPIVYTLRNKEVKGAFWRLLGKRRLVA